MIELLWLFEKYSNIIKRVINEKVNLSLDKAGQCLGASKFRGAWGLWITLRSKSLTNNDQKINFLFLLFIVFIIVLNGTYISLYIWFFNHYYLENEYVYFLSL